MRSQRSNFLRRSRPRVLRPRGNHEFGQGEKNIGNLANGLVTHGTKNERERAVFIKRGKSSPQCPRAGWVVRDVEHNFRQSILRSNDLKSSGPPGHFYPLLNVTRRTVKPKLVKLLRRSHTQ